MIDVVRLTLVSHAMTDAMAAGRFPDDEPLNDVGRRQAKNLAIKGAYRHLTAPERRARQTAELLGIRAVPDAKLADLDCGTWRGRALPVIDAGQLETWLTEPDRAPHGGESILDLMDRVAGWLMTLSDNVSSTIAVTHPAVIRAAILLTLDAQPMSFWRIDIAPAGRTILHCRDGRWTLRL